MARVEAQKLFRKAALDRLATPEQLDRTLSVTTPRAWLALLMLGAMAAAVVTWSLKGEVATYVEASGILLSRGGGVADAVSSSAGTLARIVPALDDVVEKGEVVAEIVNQELLERHRSALALVDERARALDDFRAAAAAEDALNEENVVRQRRRLDRLERSGRQSLESARERLESHRQLFEERVITRVTVERSQQAFDRAQRELFSVLSERDTLESREIQRRNEQKNRVVEMESRLQTAQRQTSELEALLEIQQILAPTSGRVTEIKAAEGAVLRTGQPVLSIKTGGEGLEVLVYVPPADGKRVEAGMEVLVSPSTVRREEYGSIRGTVESVSAFPISLDGMIAVLQNRNLAQIFSETGPPYAGRVILAPDPSTASGFAWTSPKAANETLTSGTLAGVEIKTDSQPPITLVVPLLKEVLGF